MAQTNVSQFAKELGMAAERLLEQLQAAGVNRKLVEDTLLTEQDKTQLLDYLRSVHGTKESKSKITLTRRQTTEIKKADSTGKARTIQVEVRKKRVLVKRDTAAPAAEPAAAAPAIDAQQAAIRDEEARKQAELAARQAADAAAKQERQKKRKTAQDTSEAPAPEAKSAEAAADAAKPIAAPTEGGVTAEAKPATTGTLHKPASKPGEAGEKKAPKKQLKQVVWRDESAKKRVIKTRGGEVGGAGWHARKDRHAKTKTETETTTATHGFSLPTEPIVHEVLVPETITVANLAQKMSVK